MRNLISILIFFSFAFHSYSQTEQLDQFDHNGKRDGKWMLYLNAKGEKVQDTTKAVYCRYTYYSHGTHIYPMGGFIGKNGKVVHISNNVQSKNKIQLLDGEYKCVDKKGRVQFIHVFKNGEYVSYKEFSRDGKLKSFFDYTKHCDDQPLSWYLYMYDKNGKVKLEMCIKKNEYGKWPVMQG